MKIFLALIILAFSVHQVSAQVVLSGMPTINGSVNSLIRIGDTIYIGGNFTQVNGLMRKNLARFNANTGLVDSWSPTFNGAVNMLKQVGSKLLVGGSFYIVNSLSRFGICMFDLPSGNLNSWSDTADYTSYNVGIGVYNNNFYYHKFNFATNDGKILCVNANTGAYVPWQSDTILQGDINYIYISGNYVYVGGLFNTSGYTPKYRNLCRFNVNSGAMDTAWHPGVNSTSFGIMSIVQVNSKLFFGGVYDTIAGVRRTGLASFDANGNITTDSIVFSTQQIFSLYPDGNKIWVGGIYSSAAGYYRRRLSQINTTNMLPTCWDGFSVTNNWTLPTYIFVSGDTVYSGDLGGPVTAFINNPVPHPGNISGLTQVNPLQTSSYMVANLPGCTYTWIVTGGSGSSTTNSITVNWGTGPTGSVSLVVNNSGAFNCYSDTMVVPVTIGAVGLEENTTSSYLNLYPNPTSEKITVATFNCKNADYILSDITGKIKLINPIRNDIFELDLRSFPSGIYILSIKQENGTLHKKIIKQ